MWCKTLAATGLALAFALPAAAQQSTPPQSPSSPATSSGQQQSGMTGPSGTSIRQHIKQGLEKDGFTNVQVMPAAFLAQAKDKQGHPVLMMINPDSVSVITDLSAPVQSGTGGSGSGTTK